MKRKNLVEMFEAVNKIKLNENSTLVKKLNENNATDPTKDEMLSFLKGQFQNDFDIFDAEEAIYWFGYSYHGGQSSNLYSALSTSQYKPSPLMNDIPNDGISKMMYDALVDKFGNSRNDGAVTNEIV